MPALTSLRTVSAGVAALCLIVLATPAAARAELKFLGFNDDASASADRLAEGIDFTSAAGGNVIRGGLDWRLLEPRRDEWHEGHWDFQRARYEQMLAGGITPVYVIAYAPVWARGSEAARACGYVCRYPPARSMNGEWREFATRVGREFPQAVVEVWNEPNFKPFWPEPSPDRFAELQAIAYNAIKRVSPRTKVISGGLAAILYRRHEERGNGMAMSRFIRRAYAARPSLKNHTDGLGFHPYWQEEVADGNSLLARTFESVRKARNRSGDRSRPLWLTETGITSSGPEAFSLDGQASAMVSRIDYLEAQPDVKGALIHRLWEPATISVDSFAFGYGLVTDDPVLPKPAFCALVARAGNSITGC